MSDESRPSVDERLAALDERTTPKPKTLTDRVEDWAGVGTLAIALLYTFPLGVWDRFFVTEHQQRQKETDELRSLIVKLAEKDADLARAYFSITNEQVRAFFSRAMASMKSAIISQGYKVMIQKDI